MPKWTLPLTALKVKAQDIRPDAMRVEGPCETEIGARRVGLRICEQRMYQ